MVIVCPRCKKEAIERQEIATMFGYKPIAGINIPKAYCKACHKHFLAFGLWSKRSKFCVVCRKKLKRGKNLYCDHKCRSILTKKKRKTLYNTGYFHLRGLINDENKLPKGQVN